MIVWAHSYYDEDCDEVSFDDDDADNSLYIEAFCDTTACSYDACAAAIRGSTDWCIEPDDGWEPRRFRLERVA